MTNTIASIVLFIFTSASLLNAQIVYEESITNFTLISVYDGDTFKITIPNHPKIIGLNISVRIKGIDAPEIRGGTEESKENAKKSRNFLEKILKSGDISLHYVSRDKYFRLLSDVRVNGKDVATLMIKNGFATDYHQK